MTNTRPSILKAATALILSTVPCLSQTPVPAQPSSPPLQPATPLVPRPLPAFYRNIIVIDPAHGGPDAGAHLPDNALEKDVTLAFAQRLRPALTAQGFIVAGTRDSDPADNLTTDQRAGTANRIRPLACILLHATATGSGIHIASSSLTPSDSSPQPRALAWETAQAPTLPMSLRLSNEIGLALSNAHLPVTLLRASVPPIDNLICPAVAIELAPLTPSSGSASPVTDAAYQQRVAAAVASALASFRTHNAPPPAAAPPSAPTPAPRHAPTAPAPAPAAKPGAPQ